MAAEQEHPDKAHGLPDSPSETPSELDKEIELVRRLYTLLYEVDIGDGEIVTEIKNLENDFGNLVYTEFLHLLCHLRFTPTEAKEHWDRICNLRDSMENHLETPIDIRVALLSYFISVNRNLQSPKIIELKLFEET